MQLTTHTPVPDGWFYLVQSPGTHYTSVPASLIVRPTQPDVLADIPRWEKVWDDSDSGNARSYALWRGIAPST
ncbi:hypothetical protein B0H10DRAFT_1784080 [Mycena sp. CBHHK59/15]|nr:hypothetical protein B0H10DRAFT_1784080 [Mycena sp. CBHHK59/15]